MNSFDFAKISKNMAILCTLVQQTIFSTRCILWYRGLVRNIPGSKVSEGYGL